MIVALAACGGAAPVITAETPTPMPIAPPSAPPLPRQELAAFVPEMSNGFWRTLDEIMIDDATVPITVDLLTTVRQHTRELIVCPVVTARWVVLGSPHNPSSVVFAEGCDQRVIYNFETPRIEGRDLELFTVGRVSLKR